MFRRRCATVPRCAPPLVVGGQIGQTGRTVRRRRADGRHVLASRPGALPLRVSGAPSQDDGAAADDDDCISRPEMLPAPLARDGKHFTSANSSQHRESSYSSARLSGGDGRGRGVQLQPRRRCRALVARPPAWAAPAGDLPVPAIGVALVRAGEVWRGPPASGHRDRQPPADRERPGQRATRWAGGRGPKTDDHQRRGQWRALAGRAPAGRPRGSHQSTAPSVAPAARRRIERRERGPVPSEMMRRRELVGPTVACRRRRRRSAVSGRRAVGRLNLHCSRVPTR
jgi:hypothetical protein